MIRNKLNLSSVKPSQEYLCENIQDNDESLHNLSNIHKMPVMIIEIIKTDRPFEDARINALLNKIRSGGVISAPEEASQVSEDIASAVREIINDVQVRGDEAIIDWTKRIDKVELSREQIRIAPEEIQQAYDKADEDFLSIIRQSAENIRAYQQEILISPPASLKRDGKELSVRYTPINRVGVYVPGGKAAYPSTVLMSVIPAQVAGVEQIALASPPMSDGSVNSIVLATAAELGIREIYTGAAVAVLAAMAFGTETIPPVDMIVGPGNAYVAQAKRQLFGKVGIDSIAGPSEILIIADETACAEIIAADMLAQVEHDPGVAILITTSENLGREVEKALEVQVQDLPRKEAIKSALRRYSAIIIVPDIDAACELTDKFAPEHLEIITADAEVVQSKVRNAGAIFIGPHSAVSMGDYYAGPSHVLPTAGAARFASPLSCNTFLKAISVIRYEAEGFLEEANDVINFARREGLDAHARAVEIRKQIVYKSNGESRSK